MSDLRFDPISNLWVAIARNRQERPMEFIPLEQTRQQLICPFCKGNEDETPAPFAVYASSGELLSAEDSGWTVRVIPNKYPSFRSISSEPVFPTSEGHSSCVNHPSNHSPQPCTAPEPSHQASEFGPFDAACLPGRQELIVNSPRHITSISELTDSETVVSFQAFQERLRFHQTLGNIEHSMLFMNCRSSAGASLSHIHTQLIGSPIISGYLDERHQRAQQHFQKTGRTLLQSIAEWELHEGKRIVQETENFYVICPFASRFAFQIWIVPKHHHHCFGDCPSDMRDQLAFLCRGLVDRLENLLDEPGYNLLLHHAPYARQENDHWYFELFPRLTRAAGFEWGTEIWVNPVSPESAAKRFRVE